jgi:hypothetical protein
MKMTSRVWLPRTVSLGVFAAVLGLSAPAAQAVPLDYVLFQDTGSTINVTRDGNPWFTCAEPTANLCFFTIQANSVLPSPANFNIYDDAAHTILSDTLSMRYITDDHQVLVSFNSGDGLTPLLDAFALTETPDIVDVGQITSTNTFTTPLDIEFQSTEDVPEPMSISLLGAGLVGLGALRRRMRRKPSVA